MLLGDPTLNLDFDPRLLAKKVISILFVSFYAC